MYSPDKPKYERAESREEFRATLGFDFIFTTNSSGELVCKCIEINGQDTGIIGMQTIPDSQIDKTHKIVADVRAHVNPKMRQKYSIANEIIGDMNAGVFQPSEEAKKTILGYITKSLRSDPTFKHAYRNPDFIEDLTRDKRLQDKFIPEQFRLKVWQPGDSIVSRTGSWVLKPYNSRGGDGVFVVSNDEFADHIENKFPLDNFVVQEFVESAGAQMDFESTKQHAASMRLLVDFRYLSDGTIATDTIGAYQRVAPYSMDQIHNENGKRLSSEDVYVVNKARGAKSVAASSSELELAKKAASEIIQNIAKAYLNAKVEEQVV